jgi:hypothetical protein
VSASHLDHPTADAPASADGTELAWLRRAAGDVRLAAWRLTPDRLAAYLAGVRAMARAGVAVDATDPGAVLDPDRQPALRPWEQGEHPPAPGDPDPVQTVTAELAARPGLAGVIEAQVPLAEFAAAHVKLMVCVRRLLLLAGEGAGTVTAAQVEGWVAAQRPRAGAKPTSARASSRASRRGRTSTRRSPARERPAGERRPRTVPPA